MPKPVNYCVTKKDSLRNQWGRMTYVLGQAISREWGLAGHAERAARGSHASACLGRITFPVAPAPSRDRRPAMVATGVLVALMLKALLRAHGHVAGRPRRHGGTVNPVLTALAVATGTVAVVSLFIPRAPMPATTGLFGTMTTNTSSFSAATNQWIKVHDLTSGEQVVVRCYTKGQIVGGSDVWLRSGKDDKLGFVPRSHHRRAGQPAGRRHGSNGSGRAKPRLSPQPSPRPSPHPSWRPPSLPRRRPLRRAGALASSSRGSRDLGVPGPGRAQTPPAAPGRCTGRAAPGPGKHPVCRAGSSAPREDRTVRHEGAVWPRAGWLLSPSTTLCGGFRVSAGAAVTL